MKEPPNPMAYAYTLEDQRWLYHHWEFKTPEARKHWDYERYLKDQEAHLKAQAAEVARLRNG